MNKVFNIVSTLQSDGKHDDAGCTCSEVNEYESRAFGGGPIFADCFRTDLSDDVTSDERVLLDKYWDKIFRRALVKPRIILLILSSIVVHFSSQQDKRGQNIFGSRFS